MNVPSFVKRKSLVGGRFYVASTQSLSDKRTWCLVSGGLRQVWETRLCPGQRAFSSSVMGMNAPKDPVYWKILEVWIDTEGGLAGPLEK